MTFKKELLRVAAFIDGFNVYHFLCQPENRHCKWLNYYALCENLLPRNSQLTSVQYFTAKATWDPAKERRHNIYIRALQHAGVDVVIGKFKHTKKLVVIKNEASWKTFKTVDGKVNGTRFFGYSFEEKKTDVSIACEMLSKAAKDSYDTAMLISGDTDFEPVLRTIMKDFKKDLWVVVPNKRIAGSIKALTPRGQCASLKRNIIEKSLLDDPFIVGDGTELRCPNEWKS